MPTLFVVHGFRFFFFSNEGSEPIHIHVEKAGKYAKFWLRPVSLAKNYKFSNADLKKIMNFVEYRKDEIEEKWNEFFNA